MLIPSVRRDTPSGIVHLKGADVSSPYLIAKREQFNAIQAGIDGMQTRAVDEARDLTEDELRSVSAQTDVAAKMFTEIQKLEENEARAAQVAKFTSAAGSRPAAGVAAESRDPGHYRSVKEGGTRSWFADRMNAARGDQDAARRLNESNDFLRAHQTMSTAAGNIPPVWLVDEWTSIAQNGRPFANAVRNVPLADYRSVSLPGQTASTTVAAQGGENVAIAAGDAFTSAAVSYTPVAYVGSEVVSRQLLEGGLPGIDQIILGDLALSYSTKIEAILCTAVKAAGPTAIATAEADWFDFTTPATFAPNVLTGAANVVYAAKFSRPDIFVCDFTFYTALLQVLDSTGRPLVTVPSQPSQNGIGVGGAGAMVPSDGSVVGARIIVTNGMVAASHSYGAFVWSQDIMGLERTPTLWELAEKVGPASIELSLMGGYVPAIRNGTRPVQNIIFTPTA